jgi:hypothetical protein
MNQSGKMMHFPFERLKRPVQIFLGFTLLQIKKSRYKDKAVHETMGRNIDNQKNQNNT